MTEEKNAFDPENFGPVVLIQLMRTYDLLLALLSTVDEEKAVRISQLHSAGGTVSPPPSFTMEEQ
jgi:hypothetical protein